MLLFQIPFQSQLEALMMLLQIRMQSQLEVLMLLFQPSSGPFHFFPLPSRCSISAIFALAWVGTAFTCFEARTVQHQASKEEHRDETLWLFFSQIGFWWIDSPIFAFASTTLLRWLFFGSAFYQLISERGNLLSVGFDISTFNTTTILATERHVLKAFTIQIKTLGPFTLALHFRFSVSLFRP